MVLLPFLIFTSLSPRYYRQFFYFERIWAKIVLLLCGYRVKVKWAEKPDPKGQYIICTNHTSMIDIMLTLAVFPSPFLFIGKKELSKLPIFGYFYKRTNILVDRSSLRSRKATYHLAEERLEEGLGVCIYPEGLAPREDIMLAPFKMGAFRLAASKGIPIISASFLDCKRLLPYDNFRGKPGTLRVEVHPFLIPTSEGNDEALRLRDECFQLILQPLERELKDHEIRS
jgi:1-acyl-sn-glycerol-3-phosphate acyltransferase